MVSSGTPKAAQGVSPLMVPEDRLPGTVAVTRKHPSHVMWGDDRFKEPSSPMLLDQPGGERMLITSHDCRPSRLPSDVPESPLLFTDLPLRPTIPAVSTKSPNSNLFQDVCELVNTASLASPSIPAQLLETSVSSLFNPFGHHGITNESTSRPRTTSSQVFKTGEELALHYGIPTLLPPPPTIQKQPQNQSPRSPSLDFNTLCSNYLSMISQKPSDNMSVDTTVPTPADLLPTSHMEATGQSLEEWVNSLTCTCNAAARSDDADSELNTASPQWDFLTSPVALNTPAQDFDSSPLETPFSDFLTTPVFGDGADELPFSPAVNCDLPLFGADEHYTATPASIKTKSADLPPELPYLLEMSPIPDNQSINPSSLYPSPPAHPPSTSFPPTTPITTRRRVTATGTRKNINPDKLIPLDAPQPRRYITPSVTSRKEVPAVFLKKRQRSEVDDEEDELLEPLPPNATEREQIEYKRRQNTLAARKSRKRKLMHQQELETKVAHLNDEVTRWQTRCDVLSKLLQSHGIPPPSFSD